MSISGLELRPEECKWLGHWSLETGAYLITRNVVQSILVLLLDVVGVRVPSTQDPVALILYMVTFSTDGTLFLRDHPTVEKISNDDRNIFEQGVFTIIYNVIKACTTSHIDWRHTELHYYNIHEHKM